MDNILSLSHQRSTTKMRRGKYSKYTLEEKRVILEEADRSSFRLTSQKFNVPISTIATWKKELAANPEGNTSDRRRRYRKPGGGRRLSYSTETDQRILSWVLRQRDMQLPVTPTSLRAYAKSLILPGNPQFRASNGWLVKFLRRHNLSNRMKTSVSQNLPADLETRLAAFRQHLKEVHETKDFDMSMVVNMDEVPMFFDLIPRRTVHIKGEKDVRIITTGGEKRHFTVVLAVTATGQKLPPMLIFKGKRPLDLDLPDGCIVRVNPKGWMNEEMMRDWLQHVLRPYTERRPSLLVMDSFAAHQVESVDDLCNDLAVTPAIIPGGCTSRIQPLDVGVNKPFKDRLRSLWAESICAKVSETNQRPNTTKQEVVDWVAKAWQSIPSDLVAKSFHVTGIATILNSPSDTDRFIAEFFGPDDDEEEDFLGFLDEDVPMDCEDPFLAMSDIESDAE